MSDEYEWVLQSHPKSDPKQWMLVKNGLRSAWYLTKGGRKNPGWFVWRGAAIHARMNPNLSLDEAQSAAKMMGVLGVQQ